MDSTIQALPRLPAQIRFETKNQEKPELTAKAENMSPEVEKLLLSAQLATLGEKMKDGDKITVSVDGENTLQVFKEGRDRWKEFKMRAADISRAVARGASDVVEQDPMFVFMRSVDAVKGSATMYVPEGVRGYVDQGLPAALRGIAMALNIVKARKTSQRRDASGMDKSVDFARIGTDAMGLAGNVGMIIAKGATWAPYLAAAGVVGDVLAFGYHAMDYIRGQADNPNPPPSNYPQK